MIWLETIRDWLAGNAVWIGAVSGAVLALFSVLRFFNIQPKQKSTGVDGDEAITPQKGGGDIKISNGKSNAVIVGNNNAVNINNARNYGITLAEHEKSLKKHEAAIREEFKEKQVQASAEEHARYEKKLAAITHARDNLEQSYQKRIESLEKINASLAAMGNHADKHKLERAQATLAQGDTSLADELFEEIERAGVATAENVGRAALERGRLAELNFDFDAAQRHHDRAAQLLPDDWEVMNQAGSMNR